MKHNTAAVQPMFSAPSDNASIYQLPGKWTDQYDRPFALENLRGKIQLVAMVFTHCEYACPRIVSDMQAIKGSIPESEKNSIEYVLVSFDAQRDTPHRLRQFAAQKQLDDRWVLLHGNEDQVRELSMLLNIKYQKLPNGDFSHSNAIFILDQQGVIRQSLGGLGAHTELAVKTIHQLISP